MKRDNVQRVISYACETVIADIRKGAWGEDYLNNQLLMDAAEEVARTIDENGIDWYLDEHGEDAIV